MFYLCYKIHILNLISFLILVTKGTVDTATGAFRRVHHQTEDGGENVTVVKGPMRNFGSQGDTLQPTIAIITVHYFEKMAVDAMMTNKQTFVRYATVGKKIWNDTVFFVFL